MGLLSKSLLPFRLTLRAQQIGFTFTRYGLANVVTSLGFEFGKRGLRFVGGTKLPSIPLTSVLGKDLARTFMQLGPTFIKMGQFLATRPDIIGSEVAEELKVLFDQVDPISFQKFRSILKEEIGPKKMGKLLREIDPKPLASASIAQTHRARLSDGTPIILKVQKPGRAKMVRADLAILEGLVWPLHLAYPKLNLLELFTDFKIATLREIDYREEAKNIDRFRRNNRKIFATSEIVFPRYFPELLTERVIALEPMHGKKVSDLKKGSLAAKKAAQMGLSSLLEQVFEHGFFHADPHAGNLFFLEDQGRLAFIDLGLVGQLESEDKQKFLRVFLAILQRDKKKLARSLFDMGVPSKNTQYARFESDISALIDRLKKQNISDLALEPTVNELMQICNSNGLLVPQRYILMMRSCLMIEGVAKGLDPTLSIARLASPIVLRGMLRSYSPLRFFLK